MNGIIEPLVPASSITNARALRFLCPGSSSKPFWQDALLVSKNNWLEIYAVADDGSVCLHAKSQLATRIESLQVFPLTDSNALSDTICVSFADCKLSVLEFNSQLNDFVSKSLHFFEREEYRTISILGSSGALRPELIADPEGRMLIMRVFSSYLALLPQKPLSTEENAAVVDASCVINFEQHIDAKLKNVLSVAALPGFLNPTIAILYDRGSNADGADRLHGQTTPASITQKDTRNETVSLMIVALERLKAARRTGAVGYSFTIINNVDGLPWDCDALIALPKPIGGILIPSRNLLFWCDVSSASAPFSIATNAFAASTFSGRISINSFATLSIETLRDARILPLPEANQASLRTLIVSAAGQKYLLSMTRSGRTLGNVQLESMASAFQSPKSSGLCLLANGKFLFLASECGSSQIIQLGSDDAGSKALSPSPLNRPTSRTPDDELYGNDADSVTNSHAMEVDNDDSAYLASLELDVKVQQEKQQQQQKRISGKFELKLLSELDNLGSIVDGTIFINGNRRDLVVLAGSYTEGGIFHHASINLLTQVPTPHTTATFNLPDSHALWTIQDDQNELRYLVASTESSTLVLTMKHGRLVELEESDFFLEGRTSFCGSVKLVNDSSAILQVFGNRARLLNPQTAALISDSELASRGGNFKKLAIMNGGFWLLTDDGKLAAYRISSQNAIESVPLPDHFISHALTSFAVDGECCIMVHSVDQGLVAYELPSLAVCFHNRYFSRLPVSLPNRFGQESRDFEDGFTLKQTILTLDILHSSNEHVFVVVRFEAAGCIGVAVYRHYKTSGCLARLICELMPVASAANSATPQHSLHISPRELLLYSASGLGCVVSISALCFPRLHQYRAPLSAASFNSSSIVVLKQGGVVSVVDWNKTLRSWNQDCVPGWLLRRVQFDPQRVPLFCVMHPATETLLVASAALSANFHLPADEYAPIGDGQASPAIAQASEQLTCMRRPGPANRIHLLHPHTWTVVDETVEKGKDEPNEQSGPTGLSPFNLPYEEITVMLATPLRTRQTASGRHPFVIVGTAGVKSEDRPCRGRLLVFDVAEVVPEPGHPETGVKLRLRAVTELKGPVIAAAPMPSGHLVVSMGPKTMICGPDDESDEPGKLTPVAFVDHGTCCTSVASARSFFVLGDLKRSISFLTFQDEPLARVFVLGRDYGQNIQISQVEMLIDSHGSLMQIGADDQGGLHFFAYAPNNLTTSAGQRLLDRGSFWMHAAPVSKFLRLCPGNDDANGSIGLLSLHSDGSVNWINSLPSATFRRMYVLELRMASLIPTTSGLSTRVMRQVPRRVNVTHLLPLMGQASFMLPTSGNVENVFNTGAAPSANTNPASVNPNSNATIIQHHLPVSTAFIDGAAIARFFNDSLVDGLARQTLANRFGMDFDALLKDFLGLVQIKQSLFK